MKMLKIEWVVVLLLLFLGTQTAYSQDKNALEDFLSTIEGLEYEKTPLDSLHQEAYTIFIEQLVDAEDASKGTFFQKLYLVNMDSSLPIVMVTEGYTANWNYISEPAKILKCNQMIVEHRYFGESIPDSLDWNQLTTKNAAADHHHIYEVFSEYFTNKWISTGVSKGGQTSIFYKYYYPEDMHISMPYVAPLNLEQEDVRINWFLRHVGTDEENKAILKYQKLMLENFDSIFPVFKAYAEESGEVFAVNDTMAYEFMVLEFPFSYFQWGSLNVSDIPDEVLSVKEMLWPMHRLGLVKFYYKSILDGLMPFMVQAYRELGYYDYDLDSLKPYLQKIENSSNIAFLPQELRFEYDASIMNNVYDFIHNEADRMVYIYGELDPWFSTSVNPDSRTDAIKLVLSGGSHSTRLRHFSNETNEMVLDKLNTWLDE
ncbi:MAG: hypothetical protein KAH25_10345 [Bacteroidales bacterium]|nr:hypothetical protein [Bacteroidales bacterium]